MFGIRRKPKKVKRPVINIETAPFPVVEAYKALRTNIQFAGIDKEVKKILFTSSNPMEGKTSVSVNLAVTLGQAGNKVLLIDADLRKPRIHKLLNMLSTPGLTNVLVKSCDFNQAVKKYREYPIDVLTSGPIPPNPTELLGSQAMKEFLDSVEEQYEYIILDTPPSLFMSDAAVLSKYADGAIIVIQAGVTTFDMVRAVVDRLKKAGGNILGCVLNDVRMEDISKQLYGTRYGYYKSYSNYYDDKTVTRL